MKIKNHAEVSVFKLVRYDGVVAAKPFKIVADLPELTPDIILKKYGLSLKTEKNVAAFVEKARARARLVARMRAAQDRRAQDRRAKFKIAAQKKRALHAK